MKYITINITLICILACKLIASAIFRFLFRSEILNILSHGEHEMVFFKIKIKTTTGVSILTVLEQSAFSVGV